MRIKKILPFVLSALVIMSIPALALRNGKEPSLQSPSQTSSTPNTSSAIVTITEDTPRQSVTFKLLHHDTGEVEEISELDYIKGVVAAEMPISFEPEALKAQAVAAHTYALRRYYQQQQKPSEELKGAQFSTDSTVFQAYKSVDQLKEIYKNNFDENWKKISDAVESVIDYVITYDDQPIVAAYHSMSGGLTEKAQTVWGQDVPYLQSVSSETDTQLPNYETTTTFSVVDVEKKCKEKFPKIIFPEQKSDWFVTKSHTTSGAVGEITIGDQSTTGTQVRTLFGLKSANFEVRFENDVFVFVTKGYGHGVGMSQYGANALAQQGYTFDKILEHYYSGVTVCKIQKK